MEHLTVFIHFRVIESVGDERGLNLKFKYGLVLGYDKGEGYSYLDNVVTEPTHYTDMLEICKDKVLKFLHLNISQVETLIIRDYQIR